MNTVIPTSIPALANPPPPASSGGAEESLRDVMIRMALQSGCQLFHDPKKKTYVTVKVGAHLENWPLNSQDFQRYLLNLYRSKTGTAAGKSVAADAIATLDAEASISEQREVFLRIAHYDDNIYVDLCDKEWRCVCISSTGWSVLNTSPVPFIRTAGMLPLPEPQPGESVTENLKTFRSFINARDEGIWRIVIAWMLAAYSKGPYPILVTTGEPGSAKSSLCRFLQDLVDPTDCENVSEPKDMRDVMVQAVNSWVVAFDNLRSIPKWLSDLLCTISTGSARRERELYTNTGEALFKTKRPILINGVGLSLATDFNSRAVLCELPAILDNCRRSEEEVKSDFIKARPQILGAIYDVLSSILANRNSTKLAKKPRMADFAEWVTAGESKLGWEPGDFMAAYDVNRREATESSLESDSFGFAVKDVISQLLWLASLHKISAAAVAAFAEQIRSEKPKRPKETGLKKIRQGYEDIDFKQISSESLKQINSIVERWLPDGKKIKKEYRALNPRRSDDEHIGSFSINLNNGRWSDFAIDVTGGDLIDLVAYLDNASKLEAAKSLKSFPGL